MVDFFKKWCPRCKKYFLVFDGNNRCCTMCGLRVPKYGCVRGSNGVVNNV